MLKFVEYRSTDTLQKFLDENFITYRDLNDLLKSNEISTQNLDELIFNNYPFLATSKKKLLDDILLKKDLHTQNSIFYISETTQDGTRCFFPKKSDTKPVLFASYEYDDFIQEVESYAMDEQKEILVIKIERNQLLNQHKLIFLVTDILESHPHIEENITDIFFNDMEKEEEKKRLKKEAHDGIVTILKPIIESKPTSLHELIRQLNASGVLVNANESNLYFVLNGQITSFETFVFDEQKGEEPFNYERLNNFFKINSEQLDLDFLKQLQNGFYKQILLLPQTKTEFEIQSQAQENFTDETEKQQVVQSSENENDSNPENPAVSEINVDEGANLNPDDTLNNARNNFVEEEIVEDEEEMLAQQQLIEATRKKTKTPITDFEQTFTQTNPLEEEPAIVEQTGFDYMS